MENLEELLKKASARWEQMSPEEKEKMLREQRRNYVLAEAEFGSDADEAAFAKALADDDKTEIERLNAAALQRRNAAHQWLIENGY
jgi:hypothetical protein